MSEAGGRRRAALNFIFITVLLDVLALVAAWKLTGDARYAQHAVSHLRAWLVDEATRMSPHLRCAQAIHGRETGRGTGIIETHLVEVARAAEARNAKRLAVPAAIEGTITTPWRVILSGKSLDALVSSDAIHGLEYRSMPGWAVHNTTLPFMRFLTGPADYTPVVFGDRRQDTTWAHQTATAVVFTSPVLIYGGHPQSLLDNPAAAVIKAIPGGWDETHVRPPSEIGELPVHARRNGGAWFRGVLNGKEPRRLRATLVSDDRPNGAAARMEGREMTARDFVDVPLRDGGGFVARFSR